jgi:DNA-binding transcriptional ArsR family regulator
MDLRCKEAHMKSKGSALSDEMIDLVARRFRLLGEPARLRLLQILENGERTVNDLAAALGSNQANVSRHLTALHEAGLLRRRPEGTSVYYSISDPLVFKLCDLVCNSARKHARGKLRAISR